MELSENYFNEQHEIEKTARSVETLYAMINAERLERFEDDGTAEFIWEAFEEGLPIAETVAMLIDDQLAADGEVDPVCDRHYLKELDSW